MDEITWFKTDDKLHGHPKALEAAEAAMGLWVLAGSYSSDFGLDGRVPIQYVSSRPSGKRNAAKLVSAGLWHALPYDGPCECILPTVDQSKGGWCFHDWEDCNPSAAEVAAGRQSNAARQAVARDPGLRARVRNRDKGRCRYCNVEVEWRNRRGSAGGTYDHVIPDGPSTEDNLVVCCRGCNSRKKRRTPTQAGMVLLPEPEQLF